jgi:parvulin-like peptidyl-prolyl isomerase
MKYVLAFLTALLLPVCATGSVARAADADKDTRTGAVSDVIATVGDQTITFSEINTALNSSAIVGVSIPAMGTPERDTARIILLDRFVSANLTYLDALVQGADKDPRYQKTITRFSNAILAGLYRKKEQAGEIPVTEEEIQAYYKKNVTKDTELTEEVRLQIESTLRRQKLQERLATANEHLRDDVKVVVHPENLAIEDDQTRADNTPLAEVGPETITWDQISDRVIAAGKGAVMDDPTADEDQARRNALEREIDLRIMVQKAKAKGLENDPLYQKRMKEYQKTLLTNMYREQLLKRMEPSNKELKAYYEANRNRFMVPETRKLQIVVVKTKEEADDLKAKIEAGEMTMSQAAWNHSIAPEARKNLGQVGWVNQGEVAPALNEVVFALNPNEVGGPVEAPVGWELVKVQEMQEARFTDFSDDATRQLTRRKFLEHKLNEYTTELRKDQFPVEVYQDRLVQLEQQEADMVKSLQEKAQQPGSVTEQRIKEFNKLARPPM